MASNITLAVTSCNRHDLLKQTLESFWETAQTTPQETLICEDSDAPKPEWLREAPFCNLNIRWIGNGVRMGQIYSVDRIYQDIKTDYIFHCEDDWLFYQQGFMRQSRQILDQHLEIWTVSLRGSDCNGHPLISDPRFPFKIQEPYWRGPWGGMNFNPSLRRLSDFQRIGSSYGRHAGYGATGLGHEAQLSKMHLDLGYRIAALPGIYCRHIGCGRSRAIEPLPAMPKVLIAIPACYRLDYGKWESERSPHYNPAHKAYGIDIHISGENNRIEALRETWLRDVEAFKGHVTAKLFYGSPHPRGPLADEVQLSCPDSYEFLPQKTIEICCYALENGYDFVFKADDDSYVWVDRLIRELMENCFDYAGYLNANVCTGGPGYWLSKRAMKVVSAYKPKHWAEDVTVGHAMSEANITPVMLPNHHSGFSAHWSFANGFDANRLTGKEVCIHAVHPETMKQIYEYSKGAGRMQ